MWPESYTDKMFVHTRESACQGICTFHSLRVCFHFKLNIGAYVLMSTEAAENHRISRIGLLNKPSCMVLLALYSILSRLFEISNESGWQKVKRMPQSNIAQPETIAYLMKTHWHVTSISQWQDVVEAVVFRRARRIAVLKSTDISVSRLYFTDEYRLHFERESYRNCMIVSSCTRAALTSQAYSQACLLRDV